MTFRLKAIPLCLGLLALAACNSSGDSTAGGTLGASGSSANQRAASAIAMIDRVEALAGTAHDAVPVAGSANFVGFGVMDVQTTAIDTVSMLGTARLTADFTGNSLTGAVTDIVTRSPAANGTINSDPVTGSIVLGGTSSQIGKQSQFDGRDANDFLTDFAGTLVTADDGTFVVSGDLDGKFQGTRVNNPLTDMPIKGLIGYSDNAEALRNGESLGLTFSVIAENPIP